MDLRDGDRWIATRDVDLVSEQQKDYRKIRTHWVFWDLNLPTDGGTRFERRGGWLEGSKPATVSRLSMDAEDMASSSIAPAKAMQELMRALSGDGAEG